MDNNAVKKLKKLEKKCPDCDSKKLFLISKTEDIDGVSFTKKYVYCCLCGYEDEFREKNKRKDLDKINYDEEAVKENNNGNRQRSNAYSNHHKRYGRNY